MNRAPAFNRDWCFFLDVDGTLLEFAEQPDAVAADADLRTLLRNLQAVSGGALALISGRNVADIDRMFAPLKLAVGGQHGIERRDGAGIQHRHAAPVAKLRRAAQEILRKIDGHSGLILESKGATIALHYRQAPGLAGTAEAIMREALRALGSEFELQEGKMLVEIKPGGKDKGGAIAEFMNEPPFCGRTPLFIGDDLTDEYGFAVVNSMGGLSMKVGEGKSAAVSRLDDAQAVRYWLGWVIEQHAGLTGRDLHGQA